jgi:hypothetical protein
MLTLGGFGTDAEPDRRATRERLIAEALARGWSIKRLGHAILTERAEASDALGLIDPRHTINDRDLAASMIGGQPDPAEVWQRAIRAPKPGEVTNASRLAGGGF